MPMGLDDFKDRLTIGTVSLFVLCMIGWCSYLTVENSRLSGEIKEAPTKAEVVNIVKNLSTSRDEVTRLMDKHSPYIQERQLIYDRLDRLQANEGKVISKLDELSKEMRLNGVKTERLLVMVQLMREEGKRDLLRDMPPSPAE